MALVTSTTGTRSCARASSALTSSSTQNGTARELGGGLAGRARRRPAPRRSDSTHCASVMWPSVARHDQVGVEGRLPQRQAVTGLDVGLDRVVEMAEHAVEVAEDRVKGGHSQPLCRASRAASIRLRVPVLPMADDR